MRGSCQDQLRQRSTELVLPLVGAALQISLCDEVPRERNHGDQEKGNSAMRRSLRNHKETAKGPNRCCHKPHPQAIGTASGGILTASQPTVSSRRHWLSNVRCPRKLSAPGDRGTTQHSSRIVRPRSSAHLLTRTAGRSRRPDPFVRQDAPPTTARRAYSRRPAARDAPRAAEQARGSSSRRTR